MTLTEAVRDPAVRPSSFAEFVGQRVAIANIRIAVDAARRAGRALDHLLITGPSGVGKTTVAQKHRNANHMCRRLHEDLERLGLRKRNQHDFRRSFISIAEECGANVPLLKWITHGNPRSTIMDDYTAISWEARCAEMMKVDVRACAVKEAPVKDGILTPVSVPSTAIPVVDLPLLYAATSATRRAVTDDRAARSAASLCVRVERNGSQRVGRIAVQLAVALAAWCSTRKRRELRRALIEVLNLLEAR